MSDISIIIPMAPGETAWKGLIQDLSVLPKEIEIIFVVSESDEAAAEPPVELKALEEHNVTWLHSEKSGRAQQMNAGARAAEKKFLWFLHADSRFSKEALPKLEVSLKTHPEALHYFRLRFLSDGPQLIFLNEWGARMRSCFLGTPFGDQGFCISKGLFEDIGGYPEDAEYGEDHLFVWHARQHGVRLCQVNEVIRTSARKYQSQGWLNLTVERQVMWAKQAWPQWKKLIQKDKAS